MTVLRNSLNREICRRIATELNVPFSVAEFVVVEYWKTLSEEMGKIPINEFKEISEINNYCNSFTIMHLGKFYTNEEVIQGYKIYEQISREKSSDFKSKASVHKDGLHSR